MSTDPKPLTLLMADDDEEDQELTREAFEQARLVNDLHFVGDGEELLAYLRRQGRYSDPADSPRPDLILLDLNMPRMDGRTALREIRADAAIATIPVVVLTTSSQELDVSECYAEGANSYIQKPVRFESLVEIARGLDAYWFQMVRRP